MYRGRFSMKVEIISHTENPEKLVAAAAKLCYSSSEVSELLDNLTGEKVNKFINRLVTLGHESPLEHATFTFAISGVSRTLLAQLTRHRIASYSVKSQRYVSENKFDFITPPRILEIPEALQLYEETMRMLQDNYEALACMMTDYEMEKVTKHLNISKENVQENKELCREISKKSAEDARMLLPGACTTQLITTMNVRSLWNFFNQRCCNRAQWEIRDLANEMLRQVKEVSPLLFKDSGAPCVKGACPEGSMSCRLSLIQDSSNTVQRDEFEYSRQFK